MLTGDLPAQLRARVVQHPSGCLLWTGALSDGYGSVRVDGRHRPVHVYVWEQLRGPVPDGLIVGHTCHDRDVDCPGGECFHRACLDVDHLATMTRSENNRAGRGPAAQRARFAAITHCPAGHPYDEGNTYWRTDRALGRGCRACRSEARRQHAARKRRARV